MEDEITEIIRRSIQVKQSILSDEAIILSIKKSTTLCSTAFKEGNKVLFCGNGGSAADAQHLAAELSGRFYLDRAPLFAEALHVNTSYLTAVANDYNFDEVYARLIEGKGQTGDILVGLSTSGNSKNILRAFEQAKAMGMTTIAMTGESGGNLAALADILIKVPSDDTPRIQESHIMIGHVICELVEKALFS